MSGRVVTAQSRQMLEKSAASWNTRAALLERMEAGMETRTERVRADPCRDCRGRRSCSLIAPGYSRSDAAIALGGMS